MVFKNSKIPLGSREWREEIFTKGVPMAVFFLTCCGIVRLGHEYIIPSVENENEGRYSSFSEKLNGLQGIFLADFHYLADSNSFAFRGDNRVSSE